MVRNRLEEKEASYVSSKGMLSKASRGRERGEKESEYMTCFQLDREKIVYSKAFRRLKDKTQVFLSPVGDHYRTRLTHTLEVSQIARSIARGLFLNEDLTEAIALGHDLGHTPFGHAGESALNEVCSFGFKHEEQSLRVVEVIEGDNGLNLTWEVRDGILNHTGSGKPKTLEGQIIMYADRTAYINHDIDDAIRGNIISEKDLPKDCVDVLGNNTYDRIKNMILDIVKFSKDSDVVKMSDEFLQAMNELRDYMFKNVYYKSRAKRDEKKAKNIVKELFWYFSENPQEVSEEICNNCPNDSDERIACDYIAGMTDRYAISKFQELFVPKPWYEF